MSEERPGYCKNCGAPEVWCTCVQPDDCETCGKTPDITVYQEGRTVVSCYHDGVPSRVVAGVDYDSAVTGWNQRGGG